MTTSADQLLAIGRRLADLCRQGKNIEAIDTLYSDDIVSIEAAEMPGHPARLEGKKAILDKTHWFFENHEIHGGEVKGPYPAGDCERFALWMALDVTPKVGPMAGNRMQIEEVCIYTVQHGKITEEEFLYDMTGGA